MDRGRVGDLLVARFKLFDQSNFRVYQLELLELEDTGGVTPQGVVLALVGSEPEASSSKDQEPLRTLRMHNLASLTSLARWAITQKVITHICSQSNSTVL